MGGTSTPIVAPRMCLSAWDQGRFKGTIAQRHISFLLVQWSATSRWHVYFIFISASVLAPAGVVSFTKSRPSGPSRVA